MDSTYVFLPFSLCEKFFLHFSQFSPYVRKLVSPSPYVRKFFSFSPHERKNFLPSHYVRKLFSHREVGLVQAYSVMPAWPRNSHKWPLVFAQFIVQEKPTVIVPVGEGLPEVPGTWYQYHTLYDTL